MIDFIKIFLCNHSGFLSKCHIVTGYSRILVGEGVNCNKQGRSPRSRHEVARGEGVGQGGGGGPPSPDGKKMEIRKCLDEML